MPLDKGMSYSVKFDMNKERLIEDELLDQGEPVLSDKELSDWGNIEGIDLNSSAVAPTEQALEIENGTNQLNPSTLNPIYRNPKHPGDIY